MWTQARTWALAAVNRFVRRDEGQDLIEYGVLVSLIAVGAIATMSQLGDRLLTLWTTFKELF